MSKAIQGVAELAGAVALGGLAYLTGGAALAIPGYAQAMSTLVLTGISSEIGAIAQALTSNRGINITDRRPASNRQIIYGTQMVGGTLVYESVTGHQYNQVIVIAGHETHSIQAIYLDGRKVHFTGSGNGWSVHNGIGFGGNADGSDHRGPDGITNYNFGGKVFVEARYGNQSFGDYMTSLTGNDPTWGPHGADCPSLVGCTYIYLKCTAGSMFPNRPEVRILVNGKNDILDSRTGTTGFTNNAALVLADVIRDKQFGLGDDTLNQDQFIAAANICDEQLAVAALSGSTESRYCCDYSYDTGASPADSMQAMLGGMAGRLSYVGGEWFIFPGAYVGPSLSFDDSVLTAGPHWNPYRSTRDLPNRVTGTHVSAEYPYSVAGTYYQLPNTGVQNNFDLKFTQSSYPYYATDQLHGYPNNQFLTEDNGHIRPMELGLPTVLSVTQCQRVAKINLMRARAKQGTGAFEMGLSAYRLQPCDTFNMTSTAFGGWSNKALEVTGTTLRVDTGDSGAPSVRYSVNVQETDASIYAWSTVEELTVYASAAAPTQTPWTPNPPTNLQLFSGPGTALTGSDGTLTAVIEVTWDTPLDNLATLIQLQYSLHGSGIWYAAPSQDISLNVSLITGVSAGSHYDVRIRTVRGDGTTSDWVEQDNFLVPALSGDLGSLAASLTGTQGFFGKWWRITSTSDIPSGGGDLASAPLFKTSGGTINYWADAGGTSYPFAGVQKLPAPSDGGSLVSVYARFTGSFIAPATGNYVIGLNSDDGGRLTVNGTVLFDVLHSGQGGAADRTYTQSGTISLTAGTSYPIVVEFQNLAGSGCVQLLMTLPGASSPILLDLGATYTAAGSATYADGTSVQVLQPATPGADKTTDQPIVYAGISGNLIPNGDFLKLTDQGWLKAGVTSFDASTPQLFVGDGGQGGNICSATFAVQPGNKYRFTFVCQSVSGGGSPHIVHRVNMGDRYFPNITDQISGTGFISYQDLQGDFTVPGGSHTTYTYDWVAPAGTHFATLAVFNLGGTATAYYHVVAQDYAAAAQWGADQTSSNTSADTSAVSGVPSYVIANVVPNGYKVILNPGNRTYSITAI